MVGDMQAVVAWRLADSMNSTRPLPSYRCAVSLNGDLSDGLGLEVSFQGFMR